MTIQHLEFNQFKVQTCCSLVADNILNSVCLILFQEIENGPSTMLGLQWEVSHFAISAMGAFSHL